MKNTKKLHGFDKNDYVIRLSDGMPMTIEERKVDSKLLCSWIENSEVNKLEYNADEIEYAPNNPANTQ